MSALRLDLRLAWRALRATPLASLAVVFSLALGFALAATVFGAALLWRALPYPGSSQLVLLERDGGDPRAPFGVAWSLPSFRAARDRVAAGRTTLTDVAAFAAWDASLVTPAGPHRAHAEYVSGEYFSTLGLKPRLGRALAPADAAGAPAVVLGSALWRRAFHADPAVVGRTVSVEGRALTVVGVLPDGQGGQGGRTELWMPVGHLLQTMPPEMRAGYQHPNTGWLQVFGRLRAGVSPSAVGGVFDDPAAANPLGRAVRVRAVPLRDVRTGASFRRALLVLLAAAAVLLVAAAVNTSTILLVRAHAARHALVLRRALGASRGRLARQAALEAFLLTGGGAALAVVGFRWSAPVLAALAPVGSAKTWEAPTTLAIRDARLGLDARVVAAVFAAAVVLSLLAALAPGLWAARAEPARVLASGASGTAGTLERRGRVGVRGLLVGSQVALTSALLACAVLLGRSFAAATRTELGFAPGGVLTARFELPSSYAGLKRAALVEQLTAALRTQPGVRGVSLAGALPLSGEAPHTGVEVTGSATPSAGVPVWGELAVGPDYFRTLGIALRAGREFAPADGGDAPRVAVVSAAAARALWPGRSPLGLTVRFPYVNGGLPSTVVGVAADVPYGALADPTYPAVYVPAARPSAFSLLVRHDGPSAPVEAALRRAAAAFDPTLPVEDVRPLAAHVAAARAHITFATQLFGAFAGLAVVLAALGVYGVAAGALAGRAREFAVRAALGAPRVRLVGTAAFDAVALSAAGLTVGLVLARAGAYALGSLLYGVTPADPVAFAAAGAGLAALVGLAAYLPARRAARVDPATALRGE